MVKLWGGVFFALCLPSSPLGAVSQVEDSDFQLELSSLTNKARAFPLRVQSLEKLIQKYPDETFPALITLIKDSREEPPFRYLASQKLALINPKQAVKTFKTFLENQKEDAFVRRIAAAQLATLAPEIVEKTMPEILNDKKEDPILRQYFLGIHSQKDSSPATHEKLRRFVKSKRETLSMRANALYQLETLGDTDFILTIGRQILVDRSEPEDLRKNVIILLERLGDRDPAPRLLKIAQNRQEPLSLRQLALDTLARMGEESLLPALETARLHESAPTMREAFRYTINEIKNRQSSTSSFRTRSY